MKYLALAALCGVASANVYDRLQMLKAFDEELNEMEQAAAQLDDDSDDETFAFKQGTYHASASHTLAGKCHLIPYEGVNSIEVESVYGDQGWGNKNARFNLCLIGSNGVPKVCHDVFGAVDRNQRDNVRSATIANVPVTQQAREGDCYQIKGGRVG